MFNSETVEYWNHLESLFTDVVRRKRANRWMPSCALDVALEVDWRAEEVV